MPLLNINGFQFYIKPSSVEYPVPLWNPDRTVTIIDGNLLQNNCNPSSSNNTEQFWSSPQFHLAGDYKNLSLWEDCRETPLPKIASPLPCNDSWYYTWNPLSEIGACKSKVLLPVKNLETPITDILHGGFQIIWDVSKSCKDCISSKGTCAYHVDSSQFYCNCSGTAHPEKCPPNQSKRKIAIIAGCSLGGAVLTAAAIMFLILYVRRKPPPTRSVGSALVNHQRNDIEAGQQGYMIYNLSLFSYQELQEATNFFDERNELGDGGFGAVYLGKLLDGRAVAVKRLYQENSRRFEQFLNEVKILSSLNHPHLVRLYGCSCPQSPVLLLVYEFVSNGTLADHLYGSRRTLKGLAWETRLNIVIETAQALAFLHCVDPPIFHRDVKSSNILLDENFSVKVADFGLSRLVPLNVSHVTTAPQGTPGYLDPEYHQCFQLSDKSDVYSFGVVLVEIISAKVAVDITRNRSEISLAQMAIEKIRRGALDELVDPDLKIEKNHKVKDMVAAVADLAFVCLARERESRPDMKEVAASLEEIKKMQEHSPNEQQNSLSRESAKITSMVSTDSPTSVQEKWASVTSDQSS